MLPLIYGNNRDKVDLKNKTKQKSSFWGRGYFFFLNKYFIMTFSREEIFANIAA